jgi:two-component system sensor histidine kinase RegB
MNTLSLSPPQQNMQRLLLVRTLFLTGVCGALAAAYWTVDLALPYPALLWIISALTLINILAWARLKHSHTTSQVEFFAQLLVDVMGVTLLLFFCGGADNPFVSYYLVPLCISAATLRWRYTLPLALTALTLYTLLFYFKVPLPDLAPHSSHQHHQSNSGVSLHTIGMWFNFLISSALITYFVVKMAEALREQDAQLAELREDAMHDEQLMAVATLAAGTAHELGTPLTTIKTLVSELQQTHTDDPELQSDLALLKHQIQHCTNTLHQLHERADRSKETTLSTQAVQDYCEEIIDNWLLMRPDVTTDITIDKNLPEVTAHFDPTIAQSIGNLLNNAADACPHNICINIRWNTSSMTWVIEDNGPGIAPELSTQLGQAFTSSKGRGRGLGLFLTHSTVNRYGGEVRLENRHEGGTRTVLHLPLYTQEVA